MQNFFIDNQGYIYTIVATIAIILLGVKFIPWLKSKNIINDKNIDSTLQLTALAKVLLSNVNLQDNIKDQSKFVLDICSQLLLFIESIYDAKNDDELTVAIKNAMHNAFVQLGVQVNKDVQDVIDLGIAYAINKSKSK